MKLRKVIYGVLILGLAVLHWAGVGLAEEQVELKEQITTLLNLGTVPQVQSIKSSEDELVLWIEPDEDGKGCAKNWGLVYMVGGKPHNSWFYDGRYTNVFKRFNATFQQFTKDGRKELALVAESGEANGWNYVFIFNLIDKKIKLLYQGENTYRVNGVYLQSDSSQPPFFVDLNNDGLKELLVFKEIRGGAQSGLYWTDIYGWDGKEFVAQSKKYPDYYKTLLADLERAAAEEEKFPAGNYRIYYEQIAKIYDLWNKPKEAQAARERMALPPSEMGKKLQVSLQAKGYKVHQVFRGDLDGVAPLDALVWGKSTDGKSNQLWLISQKQETVREPLAVPLPATFFEGEVLFQTQIGLLWCYRKPTATKAGMGYLFEYDGVHTVTMTGIEERKSTGNGQVTRKVFGEIYTDPELAAVKQTVSQLPLFLAQAAQAQTTFIIDGMFSEPDWARAVSANFVKPEQVISGMEGWKGKDDLSFAVKSLYRGNSLYLSVKVLDDVKIYANKTESGVNFQTDHIEICFEEKEKLYRYGIFILPTITQVIELGVADGKKPTHNIKAQWMPSQEGYWLEIEINGLTLTGEQYPLTVLAVDVDESTEDAETIGQFLNQVPSTTMATSPFKIGNRATLGIIKLRLN